MPYNREKRQACEWQVEICAFLDSLMSEEEMVDNYIITSKEEIRIQWQCGRPLLEIHRQSMSQVVHDYVNDKMNILFEEESGFQNERRGSNLPKPKHIGPHEFKKMADLKDSHYGGYSNVIRLYSDIPGPDFLSEMAPLYAWTNLFYKTILPKTYAEMFNSCREDLKVSGGALDNHVFNFDRVDLHNDIEDWPALLGYYKGPPGLPWSGGELQIPELRLIIMVKPLDQILLVCICPNGFTNRSIGFNSLSFGWCNKGWNTI